ncbi:MAG: methyltransferase domain-containing protein [candidate division NC10 bacterium]|nr:methyltransferase domain-containing protein [candidate division NC10 bacterium]
MSVPAYLLDLLVCPDCRAPLGEAGATLTCSQCGRQFAVADGVPELLPAELAAGTPPDPAWQTWAGALDRLLEWRRRTWNGGETSQMYQRVVRGVQAEFVAHCQLARARGTLLDVGCGSADITAALGPECRYVGVDPLPLPSPGGPPMVRGVGERLPFREAAFDLVLTLETLDHCQSPPGTLAEILRVLKPGGALCVEQYVTAPGWRERLGRWWRGPSAPGRPAPADSPKVTLLDVPDLLTLLRPAFAEVVVGRATQGSHVFVAARGKRHGGSGT